MFGFDSGQKFRSSLIGAAFAATQFSLCENEFTAKGFR
jgi:hypothetical protein